MHSSSHRIQNETPNIEKLKHQSKYEKRQRVNKTPTVFRSAWLFHIGTLYTYFRYASIIFWVIMQGKHNLAHSHNVSGAEEMLCI